MGLDQYAGFRDSKGNVHEEFYWRKHARLQVFFSKQFRKQNKDKEKNNTVDDLQHLGFNGNQGGVTITEEVVKDLEEAIKNGSYDDFARDGFFWGPHVQDEHVNEYKAQDEKFLRWCKQRLKEKKDIGYDCSW